MRKIVTCGAPYGEGGLGQHFKQMIENTRIEGELAGYYAFRIKENDADFGHIVHTPLVKPIVRYTPARFNRSWKDYIHSEFFDRATAKLVPNNADAVIGFVGKSLHTFKKAKKIGYQQLELMAANSHVNNVRRKHDLAFKLHGIEGSWLSETQRKKTLREYEMADVIYCASEYSRRSFLEEGVKEDKLKKVFFEIRPDFYPPEKKSDDGVFRIVYTGSITVAKGIPVLLDAFSRFNEKDAELILVGGWGTPGMRKYMQKWLTKDPRITVAPGDPRPHLHRANVCVHPSWEDGYSYSPMEAIACGVPVIVTEDTGMKEHVKEGENGFIVPTGDPEALLVRLEHLQNYPI